MDLTEGRLIYGVYFNDSFEFPWSYEPYNEDIEAWWRDVQGYVNPHVNPFDERGNAKPGISEDSPLIESYVQYEYDWTEVNPIPVELMNYWDHDIPAYVMTTKHISPTDTQDYPIKITIADLEDIEEARQTLLQFLRQFNIEPETEIAWWLVVTD